MDVLTAPGSEPFAIAALIMTALVVLEIVTSVVGISLSEIIGKALDCDVDGPGALGGLLGWINPAGVPVLILIIVALASFSATGYVLQSVAGAMWRPLPTPLAASAALLAAVPVTRVLSRIIGRIVPQDETYAVGPDDLVGRVGEVTLGPLDQGPAGRVKIQDQHGNWHFPMARAARNEPAIPTGTQVLLIDRQGATFIVIPAPDVLKAAAPKAA